MEVTRIGKLALATGEVSVPDKRAGMGIAIETMVFRQNDLILWRLSEVVPAIGGARHHHSL